MLSAGWAAWFSGVRRKGGARMRWAEIITITITTTAEGAADRIVVVDAAATG